MNTTWRGQGSESCDRERNILGREDSLRKGPEVGRLNGECGGVLPGGVWNRVRKEASVKERRGDRREDVNTQPSEGNSQGHRRSSLDCSSHCRCIQDASRMIGVGGVTFTATESNGDKMRRVGDACVASQVDLRGVLPALRTSGRRQRRRRSRSERARREENLSWGPAG